MVVAARVTELVVLQLLALWDAAGHLVVRRRRDGLAEASAEAVVQNVAAEAVEVGGADAAVERSLGGVFTRAAIVAGAGVAEAVGGVLTLRPGERRQTQTLRTVVARDAGAPVATMEAAAGLRVIFTAGASETLYLRNTEMNTELMVKNFK